MKIQLVNQTGIADNDFHTLVTASDYFAGLVTKAWNAPAVTVTSEPGDWVIYVTDSNRVLGAAGYHKVVAGKPTGYVSPKGSGSSMFGTYYPAKYLKSIKKTIAERYVSGLITVVCHELAEMICDPLIATYSSKDALGREWLIEVGDHAFGGFFNKTFFGKLCVFPDITIPAFYDLKGKAPFSLANLIKAPFTMSAKGYAYYKDANGKLVKI